MGAVNPCPVHCVWTTTVYSVRTGTGLHIRWVWPKQLQQLEDITSHAHIPGCSQCYCSECCDCTVQSKRPADVWDGGGGGGGAPFLGKPHPLEVFDLQLLYIPHPFIVTTTCICSPAHAACSCRCHTPCIAMKINVRHVCVCVCVCEHMYSHMYHSHTTHIHVHVHAHCHVVCVCVCVCVFVYGCHILVPFTAPLGVPSPQLLALSSSSVNVI